MRHSTHHRCLRPNNTDFVLSFLGRCFHPHSSTQYTCTTRPSSDQLAPILPTLTHLKPTLISSPTITTSLQLVLRGFHFGLKLCFGAVSYFPGASWPNLESIFQLRFWLRQAWIWFWKEAEFGTLYSTILLPQRQLPSTFLIHCTFVIFCFFLVWFEGLKLWRVL